jgi:hypothetical protein
MKKSAEYLFFLTFLLLFVSRQKVNKEKNIIMNTTTTKFKHVSYLWDEAKAAFIKGDEVALLVYRSNLLGADLRLTNYGGGNTSCKAMAKDPLTGKKLK